VHIYAPCHVIIIINSQGDIEHLVVIIDRDLLKKLS